MPSNRLNFSRVGQGNPTPLLIQAINSVNPQFKKRNGDYREFMSKLWELKAHLGIDDRLKKLKDRASKRLAELGFSKRKHFVISDHVGRLIEGFFERHVKSLPECFQVKKYEFIIDSAIAVALEDYPRTLPSSLQTDLRVKSLMKQFLPKKSCRSMSEVCSRCRKPGPIAVYVKDERHPVCSRCWRRIVESGEEW